MTCPTQVALKTEEMSCEKYDAIVKSIADLYNTLPTNCDFNSCPQGDWAGCILRMSGHDFMDFKDGAGGADGCTDIKHHDNAGLDFCLFVGENGVSLKDAWAEHCGDVSLADFLVMAGEVVMTLSRNIEVQAKPTAKPIDFTDVFKFGRTTAQTCVENQGHLLPNPEDGCAANERVFVQNMGLTWAETAALMGVHTLGRAQVKFSGYEGWWSGPENQRRFNNDYYISMGMKGWEPMKAVANNTKKNMWIRSDHKMDQKGGLEMMLDTDLCLAWGNAELAKDSDCCAWWGVGENKICGTDRSKCCTKPSNCGSSPHFSGPAMFDIMDYIRDEDHWLRDFKGAWVKAVENGHNDLKSLPQCSQPAILRVAPGSLIE
jgi:hypothetical protein